LIDLQGQIGNAKDEIEKTKNETITKLKELEHDKETIKGAQSRNHQLKEEAETLRAELDQLHK